MPDRILTSHAGSLPRPEELVALNLKRGLASSTTRRATRPSSPRRSRTSSPSSASSGSTSSTTASSGTRWATATTTGPGGRTFPAPRRARARDRRRPRHQAGAGKPGELSLASFVDRRDWLEFSDAYGDPNSGAALPNPRHRDRRPRLPRADHVHRSRGDRPRHRQLQGGARGGRRAGGLHERRGAGELRAVRQRVLRERPGAHVRVRGRDARGVRGDHRRRPHPAARRSGDRRELGPDQPRAHRRGLPALHDDPRRGAQPRDPRAAARTASASTSAGAAGTART